MRSDGETENWRLVAQLAEQIYGRHIHAGRAYASIEYALHSAAVVVGGAQSTATMSIIQQAKASPAKALAQLQRSEEILAKCVDGEHKRRISDLVSAMQADKESTV